MKQVKVFIKFQFGKFNKKKKHKCNCVCVCMFVRKC